MLSSKNLVKLHALSKCYVVSQRQGLILSDVPQTHVFMIRSRFLQTPYFGSGRFFSHLGISQRMARVIPCSKLFGPYQVRLLILGGNV